MSKRAFDLIFGFLALILTFPLILLSAWLVFLEDGFPIIFRQTRVGQNGQLFEMYKFRTMIKKAEQLQQYVQTQDINGNLIHKNREDPRVTRVGRILRRLSLDELPQLFNVLAGTMSLVGPRPELPYLVEKYESWQYERLEILPGMTGWWQINGRSDRPLHLHIEDDLYYIQNRSIWLDLQIIFRTLWVVITGKGAY
jgi:lipopolysaccharide/colanic/teichoic acid biosynthesis glycosyltransferase